METMKEKAEENISTIDASKSNNETKHIKALESLQKELNNVNNELKKLQEQHIKMKQENAAKMQEIELKLTEKEQKISDANKSLMEKSTCLNTTEQDLKSVRQEKINLEEELETLRYLPANTPLIHTSFTYPKLNMNDICGLKFYLLYVHTSQKFLLKSLHAEKMVIFSTEFVFLDLNPHFYEINKEV